MEERTKVVIYARVSTSTQDYTRQITELRNYAWKQNYQIVKEFSEKISGGKKIEERAAIKELLDFVKSNKVEKVLVYECSRLSRRQLDFLSIIEQLTEAGVSLYILQNGLETLLPDGRPNPIANLCFGIIAEFNNLEKHLIRARMVADFTPTSSPAWKSRTPTMEPEVLEGIYERLEQRGYDLLDIILVEQDDNATAL